MDQQCSTTTADKVKLWEVLRSVWTRHMVQIEEERKDCELSGRAVTWCKVTTGDINIAGEVHEVSMYEVERSVDSHIWSPITVCACLLVLEGVGNVVYLKEKYKHESEQEIEVFKLDECIGNAEHCTFNQHSTFYEEKNKKLACLFTNELITRHCKQMAAYRRLQGEDVPIKAKAMASRETSEIFQSLLPDISAASRKIYARVYARLLGLSCTSFAYGYTDMKVLDKQLNSIAALHWSLVQHAKESGIDFDTQDFMYFAAYVLLLGACSPNVNQRQALLELRGMPKIEFKDISELSSTKATAWRNKIKQIVLVKFATNTRKRARKNTTSSSTTESIISGTTSEDDDENDDGQIRPVYEDAIVGGQNDNIEDLSQKSTEEIELLLQNDSDIGTSQKYILSKRQLLILFKG